MHGDYRKMFARAEELEVQTCRFEKKDTDLLEPFEDLTTLAQKHTSGPHFAIFLKFNLQKSTYATMLIREFCHVSSSFENQELINNSKEDGEPQEETEIMPEEGRIDKEMDQEETAN